MRCRPICPGTGGRDRHRYVLAFVWRTVMSLTSLPAAKFQQYMYGGRPLDVRFNDRWHTFTPTAAKGGQVMPMQPDM